MRNLVLFFPFSLLACTPSDTGKGQETATSSSDADGDGVTADEGDCDDQDPDVHPGNVELCNEVDDDCDGETDEGAMSIWYGDADGDGYGDENYPIESCTQPSGYANNANDCDDAHAEAWPGGTEVCDDIDNDCDGEVDEGTVGTWYADEDADGWGDAGAEFTACTQPADTVATSGDCDDADPFVSPDGIETCDGVDNDCDGDVDEIGTNVYYQDADADGYGGRVTTEACEAPEGYVENNDDCDDSDDAISPSAVEVCNGWDDDCDGSTDLDAVSAPTWYADSDGDGFGDPDVASEACSAPTDYVEDASDCDDSDAAVSPDGTEVCDSLDNDCDGVVDDGVGATWYADGDGDGYGDDSVTSASCTAPLGYVAIPGDCDDTDDEVSPVDAELCNDTDDDCDGTIDEGATDLRTWYRDGDRDTYGDATDTASSCAQPSGYVSDSSDCNDTRSDLSPGADEECDEIDNDCDGEIDENDAIDSEQWYADADGDGYGDPSTVVAACEAPDGYVADDRDCDDTDADVVPGLDEVCDGVDNDCDGRVDESDATDAISWYRDLDGDNYGDPRTEVLACAQPPGHVDDDTDCDDASEVSYPGNDEICDGYDNDCDGTVDEAAAIDAGTWYADVDGDGYGDAADATVSCTAPEGTVANDEDCDDGEATANPDGEELCDGVDNDCDGVVDDATTGERTWFADIDGDGYGDDGVTVTDCTQPVGYVASSGDCDDSDDTIHPGADEVCDSVDSDCDGLTNDPDAADADTFYADTDGDGFGDPDNSTTACSVPAGYTTDTSDCADTDATAYPDSHGTEVPGDGIDTDCDGEDVCTDLNCDGWPDIFFPNYYDGSTYNVDSYIYYGSASGYSATNRGSVAGNGSLSSVIEDIDGDGYLDIVLGGYYDTNQTTDTYIYWGSADGHSSADRTAIGSVNTTDVCVSDLDNDGYKDIVLANYYSGSSYYLNSYIYWGRSAGYSASDRTDVPTYGAYDCETGDVDGDGYEEIVFANYYYESSTSSQTSYLYWGSSSGYSTSDRTSFTTYRSANVVFEDIDADGWRDILFSAYYDGDFTTSSHIYWGSASGYSTSDRTALTTYGSWDATYGDLDNDGRNDIAYAGYADGSGDYTVANSYVYFNSAVGYSSSLRQSITNYGARQVSAEDLNQDGYLDLVYSFQREGSSDFNTTSYVYWGSSAGYSSSSRTGLTTYGTLHHAIGDLNADGWPELVYANNYDSTTDYTINSSVYWGSSSGYSTSNVTSLPTQGAWAKPVLVGAD